MRLWMGSRCDTRQPGGFEGQHAGGQQEYARGPTSTAALTALLTIFSLAAGDGRTLRSLAIFLKTGFSGFQVSQERSSKAISVRQAIDMPIDYYRAGYSASATQEVLYFL